MGGMRLAVPAIAATSVAAALAATLVPPLESTYLGPALYAAAATVGLAVFAGIAVPVCLLRPAKALPETAVRQERQRIARDLHDGLAQELAYLLRHLEALDGAVDGETKEHLRRAAERAQREARQAINSLSRPRTEPVGLTIAQAVGEVAARDHIALKLDVPGDIRLPAARAEALARIAREAISNAARHSGTGQATLSVRPLGPRVRLRVSDSGSGFDPAVAPGGFGFASMRERASLMGGDLRISSLPGGGTEVEAIL